MKISPYVFPLLKKRTTPTLMAIFAAVCEHFQISQTLVSSKSRSYGFSGNRDCVTPRHVYCYLSREGTNSSYSEISALLGGRHHATIINGVKRCEARLCTDQEFREDVAPLFDQFGVKMPDPVGRADWK